MNKKQRRAQNNLDFDNAVLSTLSTLGEIKEEDLRSLVEHKLQQQSGKKIKANKLDVHLINLVKRELIEPKSRKMSCSSKPVPCYRITVRGEANYRSIRSQLQTVLPVQAL